MALEALDLHGFKVAHRDSLVGLGQKGAVFYFVVLVETSRLRYAHLFLLELGLELLTEFLALALRVHGNHSVGRPVGSWLERALLLTRRLYLRL